MPPKPRGRPREFDVDEALDRLLDAFWTRGFSGTSLDDLSAATGLVRPSLYAAFGDKQAIYLKALERFGAIMAAMFDDAFVQGRPLADALLHFYMASIDIYRSGPRGPRGCLAVCTAASEAVERPEIREALAGALRAIDDGFERVLEQAKRDHKLPRNADVSALARLASATLHSIAIRARAGQSPRLLKSLARDTVALICPA